MSQLHWIFRHYLPRFVGAGVRFHGYLPQLQALGFQPKVVTSTLESEPDKIPYAAYHDIHRFAIQLEEASHTDAALVQHLPAHFHWKRQEAQVVQTLSNHPKTLLALWKLRRQFPHLKAVHVGTMVEPTDTQAARLDKRIKRLLRERLEAHVLAASVVSSSVMAAHANPILQHQARVHIINHGVDTELFRPCQTATEKRDLRLELQLPEDAFIVIFVGNIIHRKGVDRLVEAWKLLMAQPSTRPKFLVVIGDAHRPNSNDGESHESREGFSREMLRHFASFQAHGLRYLPVQEKSVVARYMRASDAFYFPSRKEGLGNVLLEAMSSGLATLTHDYLGRPISDFGPPGETFALTQPAQAAAQLEDWCQNPDRVQALGESARAWAIQHLSLEKSVKAYASLYHALGITPK